MSHHGGNEPRERAGREATELESTHPRGAAMRSRDSAELGRTRSGRKTMGTLHEGGTVGTMLITAMRRFADRPAIADARTRWSYRELADAAGRLVSLFRALGLGKGDAVALLATNRAETWAVVVAAAVMGMRYTPL